MRIVIFFLSLFLAVNSYSQKTPDPQLGPEEGQERGVDALLLTEQETDIADRMQACARSCDETPKTKQKTQSCRDRCAQKARDELEQRRAESNDREVRQQDAAEPQGNGNDMQSCVRGAGEDRDARQACRERVEGRAYIGAGGTEEEFERRTREGATRAASDAMRHCVSNCPSRTREEAQSCRDDCLAEARRAAENALRGGEPPDDRENDRDNREAREVGARPEQNDAMTECIRRAGKDRDARQACRERAEDREPDDNSEIQPQQILAVPEDNQTPDNTIENNDNTLDEDKCKRQKPKKSPEEWSEIDEIEC